MSETETWWTGVTPHMILLTEFLLGQQPWSAAAERVLLTNHPVTRILFIV